MNQIKTKRIYDAPSDDDGARILVDRLWPRGISKANAKLTVWRKDIAPTNELRKNYHSGAIDFAEFSAEYIAELNGNPAVKDFVAEVKDMLANGNVTLLFAAKDSEHNNAVVLKKYIQTSRVL